MSHVAISPVAWADDGDLLAALFASAGLCMIDIMVFFE